VALQSGEVVVDVGSGTGTMARELGALAGPGGRAIGVEPNARLRSIAEERAGEQAEVTFLDGRAGALPFADGSVDVIWCERVLQHLHDPQAAIDDFARALRPGGRAILLDTDHSTRITSDVDYAIEAKINAAFMALLPNPHAARLIPRQAIQAGLTLDADVGAVALVMPDQALIDGVWLRMAAGQAVIDGTISQDEADQTGQAVAHAARAGYGLSAVTVFGFVARKALR
jgi:SAM-dependent methyltransferase